MRGGIIFRLLQGLWMMMINNNDHDNKIYAPIETFLDNLMTA